MQFLNFSFDPKTHFQLIIYCVLPPIFRVNLRFCGILGFIPRFFKIVLFILDAHLVNQDSIRLGIVFGTSQEAVRKIDPISEPFSFQLFYRQAKAWVAEEMLSKAWSRDCCRYRENIIQLMKTFKVSNNNISII